MRHPIIDADVRAVAAVMENRVAHLRGRQVFLTGGTGFFGKWLTESFLHLNQTFGLNAKLTILSRDPKTFVASCPWLKEESSLAFVQGDVRDFAFPDGRQDLIVHGATAVSAQLEQAQPDEMYSVITEGTRHLLEFTKRCEARRLLYISSGAVYGTQPPGLSHIPETYEGVPTTAYGRGKKSSEQLCLDASTGRFECVIARPFAFVGPYLPLDTHFAIGNFIRDCLENRPIVIRGDGTPLRSYLYAAELAEWLWTLLLRGEHGRAYNVGSAEAVSISDLAHLVRDSAGTHNEIVALSKKVAGALPARYVPSIERASKELALGQRNVLPVAIAKTIAWWGNHNSEAPAK